jgi:hypothetical protein
MITEHSGEPAAHVALCPMRFCGYGFAMARGGPRLTRRRQGGGETAEGGHQSTISPGPCLFTSRKARPPGGRLVSDYLASPRG